MKINSMKLTIIIILCVMIAGISAGLFYKEIPENNQQVAYVLLGCLATALVQAITDLFKKP